MAPPAATPSPLFSSVPAPVRAIRHVADRLRGGLGGRRRRRRSERSPPSARRGPEYEAIAKLSREIIEQIVWEVVPELAEVIIREHVERHVRN